MPEKDEILQINTKKLNQQQICVLFDVTRQAINKWIKKGFPYYFAEGVSDGVKYYDLIECIKWRTNELKSKSLGSEKDDLEIDRLRKQIRKLELENADKERKTISRERFEEIQRTQAHELMTFLTEGYKKNAQKMMTKLNLPGTVLAKFLEVWDEYMKTALKKFVESGVDIE